MKEYFPMTLQAKGTVAIVIKSVAVGLCLN